MNPFKLLWRAFSMLNLLVIALEDAIISLSHWTTAGKEVSKHHADKWVSDSIPTLDDEEEVISEPKANASGFKTKSK
jgi:hypothetical protein